MSLDKKYGPWVLVTGASRGIGREFVRQLAQQGFHVVLTATNEHRLRQVAAETEQQYHVKTRVIIADLSRPEEAVAVIERETADLDVGLLVSNAGITQFGRIDTMARDDLIRLINVNVTSSMLLFNLFARRLVERNKGGGIMPISSQGAWVTLPNEANYTSSKAFLLKAGEVMHVELKSRNIDVTTFLAALTDTDMADEKEQGEDWVWDFSKTSSSRQPVDVAVCEALNGMGKVQVVASRQSRLTFPIINRLPLTWRMGFFDRMFRKAVNPRYRWF